MTECQRTKDGWRFAEMRVRWQEGLAEADWRDEEAYSFNHMMPIDFWVDCLQWTMTLRDNFVVFS